MALGPINKTRFAAATNLGGCMRACAHLALFTRANFHIIGTVYWLSINGFISRRNGRDSGRGQSFRLVEKWR